MKPTKLAMLSLAIRCIAPVVAHAEPTGLCADLANLKMNGIEITKAALVSAGTTVPPPYHGALGIGPLPAHCRVDGVINRQGGIDGQEFGIVADRKTGPNLHLPLKPLRPQHPVPCGNRSQRANRIGAQYTGADRRQSSRRDD